MRRIIGNLTLLSAGAGAAFIMGCSSMGGGSAGGSSSIPMEKWGEVDGKEVDIYTLRNANGLEARIMNYGGVVVSLKTPDRNGTMGDVVLGYDNLNSYVKNGQYFGALIGRYGNRIAKGHFTLDGKEYTLAVNNAPNALHGGLKGFDKVVWDAKAMKTSDGPALELHYVAKDGEEGYPGTLTVKAVYTLTDDNSLQLVYTATTDKDTVVNLTHHSFFNLAGKGDILSHVVYIRSDRYTPVDAGLIPTGEVPSVAGTPFDFRQPTAIGARIGNDNEQLKFGKGYDHNWVINKSIGPVELMARVTEPTTGRIMEVWSSEPALQFYSGNFLDGTVTGKYGWTYQFRDAICMEPQHYPDSPNHPSFPTTELKPGQTYHNTIKYHFAAK